MGRTGTFIAVDRLYQFLYSKDFSMDAEIDIFDIVLSLRENRVLMVQTEVILSFKHLKVTFMPMI